MLLGSIVALITPFNERMEVDYNKIEELVEFQCAANTDALVVLGSTSESSTLTDEEKIMILQTVINKNKNRMKIIAAVISNNTALAVDYSKCYEKIGANYLLVVTPYYIKPNKEGIIKHFKIISESVNIPVIVYNVPSRCGINIGYEALKEIKKIPKVIGVKESNKDISHILDVFRLNDNNFSVYCGNDEMSYLFLALKCRGLINVYGNLNPVMIKKLISLYSKNTNLAFEYFYKYYDILKLLLMETNPITIKALMNYEGMKVGTHRLPLDVMGEPQHKELLNCYKKML